ncbi:Na-K-Cl cotransporter [Rubricoccus marinus]|uniref:Na-K-Cl cotransporter n=1 Tax=Rubricoccus marinus TaxID=716817 RepID=A0A259TVW3_9BACT|nr:amino acid permease [Rubricoccus marinus]OZC01905.1 Na-K-Cl cotransporter [Rubricoccus marinus]
MLRRLRRSRPPVASVVQPIPSGLGTFGGVFTPSILTILGVIMYLRFGWVVGQVGLLGTFVIVTLATSITFLTSLSIAAIATDQRVRAGGAYYMISRSLGIETGGAVGVPLYLAQALSIALYTIGFAESVALRFPGVDEKLIGLVTTVAVAVLALVSASLAIRAQYVIMAGIVLSLLALIFGSSIPPEAASGAASAVERVGFWTVFAVFFPAVTGIMAGVNMSGDLRDPNRSIPAGTFAAVAVGYAIYMLLPILLFFRAPEAALLSDPLVMTRIAVWGDSILVGVWGATLSSALGSVLGAPRVLQALARDGVLPRPLAFLGRGSGDEDTPRIGTGLTLGLALAAVWFGDLDLIAPVLSMFFLATYGVLNASAFVESLLKSPSFRPTFRVHWALSLLGFAGCLAVMFLINAIATVVAIASIFGVYLWLERRSLETTWGDVRRGVWMAVTRAGLLRLREADDSKNWRPNLLVLSGAPQNRWPLVQLASAITHNRSILTVSTVLTAPEVTPERVRKAERQIEEYLAERAVQSLVRVIAAPDPFEGAERLVDSYGLGALVPNTILLGDPQDPERQKRYGQTIAHFYARNRNVIIARDGGAQGFGARKRIDVWWGGLRGNGGLMLILAYLLHSSLDWRGSEVRIQMVAPTEKAARDMRASVEGLLRDTRTGAQLDVILARSRPFDQILRETSRDADLVLLGMASPGEGDGFADYYAALRDRTEGLPTTLFVLAAEDIAFGQMQA